ncbi:hypothetical protein [Nitrosospira briensis]|uniref:hypothetical protein n=1 Tax=Nitrosospira briensis TaxID=35799 RepID=UPI0015A56224|nr:hypothetical protein [Nitrosospira briensis]
MQAIFRFSKCGHFKFSEHINYYKTVLGAAVSLFVMVLLVGMAKHFWTIITCE